MKLLRGIQLKFYFTIATVSMYYLFLRNRTDVPVPINSVTEKSQFNRKLSLDSKLSVSKRLSSEKQLRPKIDEPVPIHSSDNNSRTTDRFSVGSDFKNQVSTISSADRGPFSFAADNEMEYKNPSDTLHIDRYLLIL